VTPGNIASDAVSGGISSEIKKQCPSCTDVQLGIQPNDIVTETETDVENAVRLHPNTNAIVEITDIFEPYVEAGLKAVGKKIPVYTNSSMGDLAGTGFPIAGDVLYAPSSVQGWFYMQAMIDLASGMKNFGVVMPIGFAAKTNSAATDPSSFKGTSPYANYQSVFEKLWGITG
jgi:hypothetical protein